MNGSLHIVDMETCTGDSICAEVCPENAIEMVNGKENAHLVCHHAMLAAVSLGLGTTIIGLIAPVVDREKSFRTRYGIPDDHRVLTSLIMGYPKYRYRQGIHRDLAGVTFH